MVDLDSDKETVHLALANRCHEMEGVQPILCGTAQCLAHQISCAWGTMETL